MHDSFRYRTAHGYRNADLDVEHQEEDRDLVELHREAHARRADRLGAALERRQLLGGLVLGPHEHGQREKDEAEADGEEDSDQDRAVGDGHRAGI